jgi:transcriptional regulator
MAGVEDVVTAIGEDHLLTDAPPFQASLDQLFASEKCTQAPILTCWPRSPTARKLARATAPLALRQEIVYICCRSERGADACYVKGELLTTTQRVELPQGTLDLLILQTLVLEAQHGWAISERVQQISNDVLRIQQGSLYPALHRLERRGWIKARWGISENNRRAKYYELTKTGRRRLEVEKDAWAKLTAAMAQVLGT